MQESITLGISGPDCHERKTEITKDANDKGMSVSAFMLWLYEEWKKRESRKRRKAEAI